MTSSKVAPTEALRDTIVAAISQKMDVPVEQVMRSRQRRPQRATEARWVAMYVLSHDVDRVGVPELEALFETTWQTIDLGWRGVTHTPGLLAMANGLIDQHRDELSRLPKVAEGRGEE